MFSIGAIPSPVDIRDYEYPAVRTRSLIPATLDLRNSLTEVRDQESQPTCVAQAGCCCKEYQERREINFNDHLSPQFIYNNRSNYPGVGMHGRDLMQILQRLGVAQEKTFNYGDTTMNMPEEVLTDAVNFKIKSYAQIIFKYSSDRLPAYSENIEAVKLALVENGPTVITLPVFNYSTVFWKRASNENLIGWHAVALCGYNASGFIARNSWGTSWGNRGYFEITYSDYNLRPMHEHWTMTDDVSNVVTNKPKCGCVVL